MDKQNFLALFVVILIPVAFVSVMALILTAMHNHSTINTAFIAILAALIGAIISQSSAAVTCCIRR